MTHNPNGKGNSWFDNVLKILMIFVLVLMSIVLLLFIIALGPIFPWPVPVVTPTHTLTLPPTSTYTAVPSVTPSPTIVATPTWTPSDVNNHPDVNSPPPVPNAAQIKSELEGVTIEYWGGDLDTPGSLLDQKLVEQFTKDTGIEIIIKEKPRSATDAYKQLQDMFAQGNSPDVIVLDVIWLDGVAKHLRELKELNEEAKVHLLKYTTNENKLVAIPWSVNFGLLYYRPDLLQKYGYNNPPATWNELEEMATKIQDEERATRPDFWGFVWQGATYEGLTCNALEWIASSGGKIIENNKIILGDANAIEALYQAQSWVGTISPQNVTNYREGEALSVFQGGDAVFMRHWSTAAYSLITQGKALPFDIAPLPTSKAGMRPVGTLGGSALGISRDTENDKAAIEFVRYMTSPNVQEYRALFGFFIPTIPTIFQNIGPKELSTVEYLPQLKKIISFMLNKEIDLVERPSSVAGDNYDEASAVIFGGVHQILSDKDIDVTQVVSQTEQALQ